MRIASVIGYGVLFSGTVSIWFLCAKQVDRQVGRQIGTTICRQIIDLQLYIALAAYAQDVDYFYIVLILQICMFNKSVYLQVSQICITARRCQLQYFSDTQRYYVTISKLYEDRQCKKKHIANAKAEEMQKFFYILLNSNISIKLNVLMSLHRNEVTSISYEVFIIFIRSN